MDRFREMEVFAAVLEAGSFVAAAARLRMSPPAITRAVNGLEERLGVRLLNRTTRSLNLTDSGARFLDNARTLLASLDEAERAAMGETATPRGQLTVTAPATFGRRAFFPVVRAFASQERQVSLSVLLLDRVVNLVEEGIDVGVRIGHLPDSGLIARKVGEVRPLLMASPGYLAAHGTPEKPDDLKAHDIIAFTGLMPSGHWRDQSGGAARAMALQPRMEVNDAASAIEAAEEDEGIVVALSYMAAESLRDGRLRTFLDDNALPPLPVHLIHAESRLATPNVRAFMAFAAPRLERALEALAVPTGD
jgi:DNA-binding transcriptional LysR family regulator